MRCDVSVGVAGQARLSRPEQPGEIQRAPVTEWMDVRPHTYLRQCS
jgi:hypothetical protein